MRALGSDPVGARLGGIPADRTRVLVLMLVGAMAGLTGSMFLGVRQAIDPVTGGEFLLPVVAAVVIGGTPLPGGRGPVAGAVLGAVIIIAVAVDQLVRRQGEHWSRDAVDAT